MVELLTAPGMRFRTFVELPVPEVVPDRQWIRILPIGRWEHSEYGEIEITAEDVKRFEQSFRQRAFGQDIAVDIEHEPHPEGAPGWIVNVEARDDGLWAEIEWTELGKRLLQDKRFKYVSPEFYWQYRRPDGQEFTHVLTGLALTNRPFFKDHVRIAASEGIQILAEAGGWRGTSVRELPIIEAAWDWGENESRYMAALLGPDGDNWDAVKAVHAMWRPPGNRRGDYKLPFGRRDPGTDPRGRLVIVRRGLIAAMAALMGARGGVDAPESAKRGAYRVLAAHYRRAGMKPPEFRGSMDAPWPDEGWRLVENRLMGPGAEVIFHEGEEEAFRMSGETRQEEIRQAEAQDQGQQEAQAQEQRPAEQEQAAEQQQAPAVEGREDLAEEVRQLRERLEARERELAELIRAREKEELVRRFSEHKFGTRRIAPAHAERLADLALKLTEAADREAFVKAILELEFVEEGERGFSAQPSDVEQQYEQAVQKVMQERRVTYGEAVRIVAAEQPELAARFYEERRRSA